MKNVPSGRLVFVLGVLLAMGVALFGYARPAAAWNTPRQTLHPVLLISSWFRLGFR